MTSEMLIVVLVALLAGAAVMAFISHFTSRAAPTRLGAAVQRDAVEVIMEQIRLMTDNSGSVKIVAAENAKMQMRAASLVALQTQLAALLPPATASRATVPLSPPIPPAPGA